MRPNATTPTEDLANAASVARRSRAWIALTLLSLSPGLSACGDPEPGADGGSSSGTGAATAATAATSDGSAGLPSAGTSPESTATETLPSGGDEEGSTDAEAPTTGGMDEPPEQGPAAVDLPVGDRSRDRFCEFDGVHPSQPDQTVGYTLFIPGGIEVLRGLALGSVFNPVRQETARLHNFGGLGYESEALRGENMREAFLASLEGLASTCGHPELVNAVFIGTGYSASSGTMRAFINAFPDRYVGYIPGGLEVAPNTEDTLGIPWLAYYGGADGGQPPKHLANIADMRPQGALYGIAPMWGVGHEIGWGINLLLPMFHQSLARRYPKDASIADGPIELVRIDEAEGWLGSLESFEDYRHDGPVVPPPVAPYGEYPGDPAAAAWLLDGYMAHTWQSFVGHPKTPVRIVDPPGHRSPAPQNPMVFVEQGTPVTVTIEIDFDGPVSPSATLESVELYSGDLRLGRVQTAESPVVFEHVELAVAGPHPLIAAAHYDDGTRRVSLPNTVQVVRAGCPPTEGSDYMVVCLE